MGRSSDWSSNLFWKRDPPSLIVTPAHGEPRSPSELELNVVAPETGL